MMRSDRSRGAGRESRVRRKLPDRTALSRALVIAAVAWVGAAPTTAGASGPLLSISVGGAPPIKLGGGGSTGDSSTAPVVGVSLLGGESEQPPSLVSASVGEQKLATVPLPVVSVPEVRSPVNLESPVKVPVPGSSSPGKPKSGGSSDDPVAIQSSSGSATAARSGTASIEPVTRHAGEPARRARAGSSPTATPTHRRRARTTAASDGPLGDAATPATGTAGTDPATRIRRSTSARRNGTGGTLAAIGRDLPLPLPVPDWSKPIILLLALIALAAMIRSRLATRRAAGLERQQRSLRRDLDAMQAALVPEVPAALGDLKLSVAYRPAEGPAAGGDFYDVFKLDEDRVAIILGDVAGHGYEALQRAARARFTVRAHVLAGVEPRAALSRANRALSDPEFGQLATAAVAVFDARRGSLTYALAGHPAPILCGTPAPDAPARCSSPPLGWNVPTGRRQRTITLPAGARVCFFSDGLIEARCTPSDPGHQSLLGREGLRALLESLATSAGAPELLEAVRAHALATPDDMAACIISAQTPAETAVDREELELDDRAIEAGHFEAFLLGCGLAPADAAAIVLRAGAQLRMGAGALAVIDRSSDPVQVRLLTPAKYRPPESQPVTAAAPQLAIGA
jgi:serine phosphatase RsbU (regulator of sigma subunit)